MYVNILCNFIRLSFEYATRQLYWVASFLPHTQNSSYMYIWKEEIVCFLSLLKE